MEAQRKRRWREGRLNKVDAPWKLSPMEDIPGEQWRRVRQGCLSCLGSVEAEGEPQKLTRPCSFNMGEGVSERHWSSLSLKLKGKMLLCSFVRRGWKLSLEKENCSWKGTSLSHLLRRVKENACAQLLNPAWKAKKNLWTRRANNISAQDKNSWSN